MFKTKISLNNTVNVGVNVGANVCVNDGVNLSVTEQAVLNCLKADNALSAIKIAEIIEKDKRTVERTIKSLKENGYIQRLGSDKTGSWKVLR